MPKRIGDDEQRRDRPQPPCALRVPAAPGTRPTLLLGQAPRPTDWPEIGAATYVYAADRAPFLNITIARFARDERNGLGVCALPDDANRGLALLPSTERALALRLARGIREPQRASSLAGSIRGRFDDAPFAGRCPCVASRLEEVSAQVRYPEP